MSNIYVFDRDAGKRILRYLECDSCGKRIKPGEDVINSGWVKTGHQNKFEGEIVTYYICDECSRRQEE